MRFFFRRGGKRVRIDEFFGTSGAFRVQQHKARRDAGYISRAVKRGKGNEDEGDFLTKKRTAGALRRGYGTKGGEGTEKRGRFLGEVSLEVTDRPIRVVRLGIFDIPSGIHKYYCTSRLVNEQQEMSSASDETCAFFVHGRTKFYHILFLSPGVGEKHWRTMTAGLFANLSRVVN